MLSLTIDQAKDFFFDRPAVIAAIDRGTRQALSRGGAIVRREARTSIKKGTVLRRGRTRAGERRQVATVRSSKPGNPPFSQTGLLRQHIYFAADLDRQSVVIGPARLNAKDTSAPSTLEYGGTATVRRMRIRRPGRTELRWTAPRQVRIAPRPYMNPALARVAGRLPEQFRGSVV